MSQMEEIPNELEVEEEFLEVSAQRKHSPPKEGLRHGERRTRTRGMRREEWKKEMIRLNEEARRDDTDDDEGPPALEESDDEAEDEDEDPDDETEDEDEEDLGSTEEPTFVYTHKAKNKKDDMKEMGSCWAFGAETEERDRRRGRWITRAENVKVLQTIEPEGVNAVTRSDGWEEITMYVDSGATETVMSEDMLASIKVTDGPASRRGVTYEIANGVRIPNLGERRFKGVIEDGSEKQITAQVCSVNQALLSVSKAVRAGNRVVFDQEGSYIEDKSTGQVTWLVEGGGMYAPNMLVKEGF